jgi:hypothetical protein
VIQKLFTGNIPPKKVTPLILGGNYARSSQVFDVTKMAGLCPYVM